VGSWRDWTLDFKRRRLNNGGDSLLGKTVYDVFQLTEPRPHILQLSLFAAQFGHQKTFTLT